MIAIRGTRTSMGADDIPDILEIITSRNRAAAAAVNRSRAVATGRTTMKITVSRIQLRTPLCCLIVNMSSSE